MSGQRNPYKGTPRRPWLRLTFLAPDAIRHTLDLLADTGCPYDLILNPRWFELLARTDARMVPSNFGELLGGWLRLYMPDDELVELVRGYSSETVGSAVAADHPDFAGLVGLPVLRLGEYGGDADSFWFRTPPTSTPPSRHPS